MWQVGVDILEDKATGVTGQHHNSRWRFGGLLRQRQSDDSYETMSLPTNGEEQLDPGRRIGR